MMKTNLTSEQLFELYKLSLEALYRKQEPSAAVATKAADLALVAADGFATLMSYRTPSERVHSEHAETVPPPPSLPPPPPANERCEYEIVTRLSPPIQCFQPARPGSSFCAYHLVVMGHKSA